MKFIITFLGLLILTTVAGAQTYHVDWYVIGSGGGHAQSANYQIDGTIGQPIVGHASSANYQVDAGFWVGAGASLPCDYLLGDINSDGQTRGSDVTYGVRYFKGLGPAPADSCYDPAVPTISHWLYVAGDVNNDCQFKGSDITRLVQYFKGLAILQNCYLFPPPVMTALAGPTAIAYPDIQQPNQIEQGTIVPLQPQQDEDTDFSNPSRLKKK